MSKSSDNQGGPHRRAICFADVVDSSRLYATYGNTEARRMVADALSSMSAVVARHDGVVIKTIGDEIMCAFPTADQAIAAAVAMQQQVREAASAGTLHQSLSVRIGLHEGPVVQEGADMFGDAVNLAARMAAASKAHQIMTTRETVEQLDATLRPLARFVDQTTIKGQSGAFTLYEIVWDMEEATLASMQMSAAAAMAQDGLRLEVRLVDKSWTVDLDRPSLSIGRSHQCDVVVDDVKASRLHAKIEMLKDRIFLKDCSTNGTHLRLEDSGEQLIRRDEFPITSSGLLCLGRPVDAESPFLIKLVMRREAARL